MGCLSDLFEQRLGERRELAIVAVGVIDVVHRLASIHASNCFLLGATMGPWVGAS
jgi:hypothetical protein